MTFAAIDFETADHGPDSACAVGVVRVNDGRVTAREHRLIRPPRKEVFFTYIHGLRWDDLHDKPAFSQVWGELKPLLDGVDFIAAHNAPFDRGVLSACCAASGLPRPATPFLCTVALARRVWGIRPTRLPDVCGRLRIPLRHHEALSDAEACAAIVLAAAKAGASLV